MGDVLSTLSEMSSWPPVGLSRQPAVSTSGGEKRHEQGDTDPFGGECRRESHNRVAFGEGVWRCPGGGRLLSRSLRPSAGALKELRITLVLLAFGAFAMAMLYLGLTLRVDGFRGEVKELVARVESQVLGYEPLP
jgi:hypothetical protein